MQVCVCGRELCKRCAGCVECLLCQCSGYVQLGGWGDGGASLTSYPLAMRRCRYISSDLVAGNSTVGPESGLPLISDLVDFVLADVLEPIVNKVVTCCSPGLQCSQWVGLSDSTGICAQLPVPVGACHSALCQQATPG